MTAVLRGHGLTRDVVTSWLAMDTSRYHRIQATLFVPPPAGPRIDEIRSNWDPVMATRIRSHITVLRRVTDLDAVAVALSGERPPRACRVKIGGVHRADPTRTGGIYLAVEDLHGDLDQLRVVLRAACGSDADAVQDLAHVTLVHPRTTTPEHRGQAWEALRSCELTEEVAIRSLDLIGEGDEGWSVISSFILFGP